MATEEKATRKAAERERKAKEREATRAAKAEAAETRARDREARTVGLRTFRRGGTTDAKDCNVQPEAVDIHCRWRDRGVSTQDIYDARSIKRRVRVSEAMLA